jgi:hypothetical protein
MKDVIGGSDMIQGSLTSFIEDRFGSPNSALALNGGWTQAPSGVYFNSPEFTISVWVYPQNVDSYAHIIDFGPDLTPTGANHIALCLSQGTNKQPILAVHTNNENITGYAISNVPLNDSVWYFLAATFDGKSLNIYVNGVLRNVYSPLNYILPLSLVRNYNYIGKSYKSSNGFSHSYIDDLKFFNKSLNVTQINQLMSTTQFVCTLSLFTTTTKLNSCASNPCMNNGTCYVISNDFYNCTCSNEYVGTNCQLSMRRIIHLFIWFLFKYFSIKKHKEKTNCPKSQCNDGETCISNSTTSDQFTCISKR